MSKRSDPNETENLAAALGRAREQQAATQEILESISRNRDDEAPVFDMILENAARLCRAPHAGLLLRDADDRNLVLVAGNAAESGYMEYLRANPHSLDDETSLTVEAVRSMQVRQYPDIEALESGTAISDQLRNTWKLERMRTLLYVPLIKGDRAIGVIGLYRLHVEEFSDDDIDILKTFAAQAVIAIENVRQFREVQERLDREIATGQILGAISRSRADTTPVFEEILESAARLCRAPMAWLMLLNADQTELELAAYHGPTRRALEIGQTWPMTTGRKMSGLGQALVNVVTVQDEDLTQTQGYLDGDPGMAQLVNEEGLRTRVSAPLVSGGTAIGAIVLSRRDMSRFSEDDIRLADTFAGQAVIAIENVRQFQELEASNADLARSLDRQTSTASVLDVISQNQTDVRPVFDAILQNALTLCASKDASLFLVSDDGAHLELVASEGGSDELSNWLKDNPIPLDDPESSMHKALMTAQPVHILDLRDTGRYRNSSGLRRKAVDKDLTRTVLQTPLILDGKGIGILSVYRNEVRGYQQDEIDLLRTFAAQAVIAIENVRQFNALEALNTELGDRVQSQVAEIDRMSRLKRFLPSAVADAVVSAGDELMLSSHRALVATLFCDLRGFTAFCEAAEPEETIDVLQTYHQEMSKLIDQYGGGVDQRAGDGIMVIFNDPIPVDDPAGDAVRLALAMRMRMRDLCAGWKKLGHRLGFGVGISFGYATVGIVGSAGRFDYTASGTTINTAARLCDLAVNDEILMSPRAWAAVEDAVKAESRGDVEIKGIREPVEVFAVAAD